VRTGRFGPDSLTVDAAGPVHIADFGGPANAPVALCVHGLGGSSAGWRPLADALRSSYRVLALDLPGHGRTPTAGRPVSVQDAAPVLHTVIERLGLGPVTLVGHSMGSAVSVLAAAGSSRLIGRLLLLAPPLPRRGLSVGSIALLPHIALCLWPRAGVSVLQRRMARQTLEEFIAQRLRLTCASVNHLSEVTGALVAELEAAYELGEDPVESFVHAARSVGLLVADGRRYRSALLAVRAPVQVVHGALDRVLGRAGLRQLADLQPAWPTHLLPHVGHSPHLEAPETVARILTSRPEEERQPPAERESRTAA
jgi:pimeloyl-ACP methyl ester carboxylesterase